MSELVDTLPAFAWMLGAALVTYPLAVAAIRMPRLNRRKGPR
mgnify:CR=1 FL=1|jgi:hypothetical protein